MKKILLSALMGVFAFGALTLSSCGNGDDDDPTVINITTHPASPAALTEGNITGSLTVAASVTPTATLSYQWYNNTSASNSGGTAISGATSANFAIPTTLTDGTYYYFCEVSATGATAKRSNVATVTVNAASASTPTYTINASLLTSFGSLPAPYEQPAAQTVTITNTGTEAVTLTQPTATDYLIGQLSATNLASGAAATFTVQPKAGLAEGAHNEQIDINGSGGASTSVNAQFTVTAPTYTISASPITSFGSLQAPYEQPAAQTVTITNTGTGTVTLTQPTATDYLIGQLSAVNLASGATATFTVQPKAALAEGTHDEQIDINGSDGASTSVDAQFTVTAPTYTISASPITSFGSRQTPYEQPAAKTVTITNTGTGTVTLTQPTAMNYLIGQLSAVNLASGETATFTVQPKAGLGAATYNEQIDINGSDGAWASVNAQFAVTATASTGNEIDFGNEDEERW